MFSKASMSKKIYYHNNPEALQKLNDARAKKLESPEYRQKLSEDAKHRFETNTASRRFLQNTEFREIVAPDGEKTSVHKDEVLFYLKHGYFLTIQQVRIHNLSTKEQRCIVLFQKGKDYKLENTPKLIKLLEEGWVLGHLPRSN